MRRTGGMKHWALLAVLVVQLTLVGIGCSSCRSLPSANPEPLDELKDLVEHSIHQWLDVRIDEDTWSAFNSEEWPGKVSVDDIHSRLVEIADTDTSDRFWDIKRKIDEIRESDLYKRGPPEESEFVRMIAQAMESFLYEE